MNQTLAYSRVKLHQLMLFLIERMLDVQMVQISNKEA